MKTSNSVFSKDNLKYCNIIIIIIKNGSKNIYNQE